VLSGAEEEGVSVSEADVNARLDQLKQQVAAQGGNFEQALKERNLTEATLRNQLRVQVAAEKISAKLVPGPSDAALLAPHGERKQQFLQVHVRHVLVRDEATAQKVRSELEAGGDWGSVARRYSTDTGTKERGGDLGFQSKGETVPPFEKAAYDLAGKGSCKDKTSGRCESPISNPVKTEFGWHVLQVTELRLPPIDDQLRGHLLLELVQAGVDVGLGDADAFLLRPAQHDPRHDQALQCLARAGDGLGRLRRRAGGPARLHQPGQVVHRDGGAVHHRGLVDCDSPRPAAGDEGDHDQDGGEQTAHG
jgi:hypothetical protein